MTEPIHIAVAPHRMACGAEFGVGVFAWDDRVTCEACLRAADESRAAPWPPPIADVGVTLTFKQTGRWRWRGGVVWNMSDGRSVRAPVVFTAWTRDGLRSKMLAWVACHKLSTDVVVWRESTVGPQT